jgi:putative ATP-binding cassette transporter
MEFFKFLQKESTDIDRRTIMSGLCAGLLSTLMIFNLTAAANKVARGGSEFSEVLLVLLCLWGYWKSKGFLMTRTTVIVEKIVEQVRIRLANKIRGAELQSIEKIGKAPLYNVVSIHAATISKAATGLSSGATAFVLLVCASLVMFFLSSTAFVIFMATQGVIILMFLSQRSRILAGLSEVARQENIFTKAFGDLFEGFKELKMNSAKDEEFFRSTLLPAAEGARQTRVDTSLLVNRSVILATSSLFILLATVVFLVPIISPGDGPKLVRIATLIVFMFGPIGEVVGIYPYLTEAIAAIHELYRVESELDLAAKDSLPGVVSLAPVGFSFERISCENISFSYRGEKGESSFSLEPFNFQLERGEIVFITGGNGSGKSTFLKVLAGLYPPAKGKILVNDSPIGTHNLSAYRNLFSAVFSDFHLFDQLYGLKEVDEEKLRMLLNMTELSHKISVTGRNISTIALSSGQRKRLALVFALLENKPVYLFDEWAAEQDPQFRRKFYREIIPGLKREGKTVVAVTHDDDYCDAADRVLKMQYGQFVPYHSEGSMPL